MSEEKYLQLVRVQINRYTKQSRNETVTFKSEDNEHFYITSGAVDCKRGRNKTRRLAFPIAEWDMRKQFYIDKGYRIVDDQDRGVKTVVITDGTNKPIEDPVFRTVLERFVKLNNEMITEQYSKSVKIVAPENLKAAQDALLDMTSRKDTISIQEFNSLLMNVVWTRVPRLQNQLYQKIAHGRSEFESMLAREQETLDNLMQFLSCPDKIDNSESVDILTANGITEYTVVSPEEKTMLKTLMTDQSNRFKRAWSVHNEANDKKLASYCNERGLDINSNDVQLLFHGTGVENIWSIMKHGLYLNPAVLKSDVRICGKAYGYGSYFAPYCYKSMAYASSCFGSGRHSSGYLLVFRVATGNPYYINRDSEPYRPRHYEDFHKKFPKCDVCWAEAGETANNAMMRLRWDEVIAYREDQSALAYIIEYTC